MNRRKVTENTQIWGVVVVVGHSLPMWALTVGFHMGVSCDILNRRGQISREYSNCVYNLIKTV